MKRFYEYFRVIQGIIHITDGRDIWEGPIEDCPLSFALKPVRYFEPVILEGKPALFVSVIEDF